MSPTTAVGLVLLGFALRDGPEARELARRIRQGDREAFRMFFARHHGRLFGYIRSRGVPESDASDLVQNAFVHIWTHRRKIDPKRSLRSYLFRIGYTRTLDFYRDRAEMPDIDLDLQPGGSTRSPETVTQISLLRETVDAAIETLPERRRAAFRVCFLEGMSYGEAAEVLSVTRKTIENHISHALRDLREALDGFEI